MFNNNWFEEHWIKFISFNFKSSFRKDLKFWTAKFLSFGKSNLLNMKIEFVIILFSFSLNKDLTLLKVLIHYLGRNLKNSVIAIYYYSVNSLGITVIELWYCSASKIKKQNLML